MKSFISFQSQRSFTTITSVLIISAIIFLLIIGMFRTSVGEIERSTAKEKGTTALSLSNLCAEIVLKRLKEDPNYRQSIEEKIEIAEIEGSCYILSVEDGDGGIVIKTKGEIGQFIKKITLKATIINDKIEIIKWVEND